jgi:hypothetical protein
MIKEEEEFSMRKVRSVITILVLVVVTAGGLEGADAFIEQPSIPGHLLCAACALSCPSSPLFLAPRGFTFFAAVDTCDLVLTGGDHVGR